MSYKLAAGGMATVFLARVVGSAQFEKVVAVKTIHPHMTSDPAAVRMFHDEARLASAISHPNVCQVFDFGEQNGTHYLVMEYLFGEPLSRVTKKLALAKDDRGKSKIPFYAARIIADAAEGLHAAHELKDEKGVLLDVVHRDVSPQNVFVTYEGAVKVVDFGVAKARARLEETRTGDFKGKFEYIAPEQIRGKHFDRRVDVWALGVCLWELLALRRLFRREEVAATLAAVATEPIAPPSTIAKWVPPELDAIVLKALERNPEDRYPTTREFGRALRGFLTSKNVVVDVPEVGEWMSKLFPEDKAKRLALKNAVSSSTSSSASDESIESIPNELIVSGTPSRKSGVLDTRESPEEEVEEEEVASGGNSLIWIALIILLIVGGGAGTYLILTHKDPAADPEVDPTAEVAPAPRQGSEAKAGGEAVEPAVAADEAIDAGTRDAEAGTPKPVPSVEIAQANATVDAGAKAAPEAPIAVAPPATRKTPPGSNKRPPDPPPVTPKPPPVTALKPPPTERPTVVPERVVSPRGSGFVKVRSATKLEVVIDGKLKGMTPLDLELAVGTHQVELREPGGRIVAQQALSIENANEYELKL